MTIGSYKNSSYICINNMKVMIDTSFDFFKEEKETPREKKQNELRKLINSFPRFEKDMSLYKKTKEEKELLKKLKSNFKK